MTDSVTPDLQKLTEQERSLLRTLHTSEFRLAPWDTSDPTIVGLWERGLIEGRLLPDRVGEHKYSKAYEWRLK